MNLKQLSDAVNQLVEQVGNPEEIEVGVRYFPVVPTLGGTPVTSVNRIYKGFDWDENIVIITTANRLHTFNPEEFIEGIEDEE